MRRSRQIITSAVFALVILALIAAPASAGRHWCRADPIVRLGGTEYQVIVSIPEKNVPQVNGALLFEVYSPVGMQQELLFVDSGFNGYGEEVILEHHKSQASHLFALDVRENGKEFQVLVEIFVDGELLSSVTGTSRGMQVSVPVNDNGYNGRGR